MKIFILFTILHEIYSTGEIDGGEWIQIVSQTPYSQNQHTNAWLTCTLGNCDIDMNANNWINFDHPFMSQLSEFTFKFVWEGCTGDPNRGGVHNDMEWLQWTQQDNPLSAFDTDMNPTDVSWDTSDSYPDPTDLPGAYASMNFKGLSLSEQGRCLLDGSTPNWSFYSIGMDSTLACVPNSSYPSKTKLYVFKPDVIQDPCVTDNGGCDDNASCSNNNGVAQCACNSGYTGDGATCTAFPCPSEDCWTLVNGRCVAIESCASVSCTDTGMTVTINAALQFSLDQISPTPVSETVTLGGSDVTGFTVSCAFFDCGMTHAIENNELTFTLSMAAPGEVLTVGGVQLLTSSEVAEGRFHCSYPIDVEVASGSYDVSTPTAAPGSDTSPSSWTGGVSGGITLSNRFTVAGNVGPMTVGAAIETSFTLDFPTSSGITFTLRSCRVQTGSTSVNIIDGGCYSQALTAQPLSFANGVLTISYEAFTSVAATERESQDLTCSIRLCMSTCTRPTGDDQCPTGGNAASYQYAAYYDVFTT